MPKCFTIYSLYTKINMDINKQLKMFPQTHTYLQSNIYRYVFKHIGIHLYTMIIK